MRSRVVSRKSEGQKAVIRPLDPSDPRSLDHPSHREQWLEFARAIGRQMARAERDGLTEHIGDESDVSGGTG
jgi:hypothetical protein